ncbi:MAG TPA: TetR/AcrR family transcriptional regulator [Marmoricola sp.]|nr:TetR/AcrR family transcriptional regulator [Marmoricola sp.]
MTSLRHNGPEVPDSGSAADLALDAARDSILAVGWSRTTLTEVARRAGVSRMTIYRRWSDMGTLLGDLMTREWTGLVRVDTSGANDRERLVRSIVGTVQAVRANPLFDRIIELDPERLLPYLLERPGRSQALVLTALLDQVRAGQASGDIRPGDPELLARSIVLACHGFALSARTMTRPGVSVAALDAELGALVDGYLRP